MHRALKQQLVILTLIVLVALVMAGALFLAVSLMVRQRSATVDMLRTLASVEAHRATFAGEYDTFQKLKERAGVLEQSFYQETTIPLFLADLETVARGEGIDFEITTVAIVRAPGQDRKNLNVEFRGSGSYQRLFDFMKAVERRPARILFDRLYLLAGSDANSVPGARKTTPSKTASEWQIYGTMRLTTFKE